jgi:hypothetical protein
MEYDNNSPTPIEGAFMPQHPIKPSFNYFRGKMI